MSACDILSDERRPRLARGVRLRTDPLTGDPLLLFPEGFLNLDQTANDILLRCDGQMTVAGIVAALGDEYEADAAGLRADVVEYLAQLRQEMLLEW